MHRRDILAGAFAMVGCASVGAGKAAALSPTAQPLLEPALFDAWSSRFLSPGGRVIDDGNGGISHSEGQGYGMLLAAFAGDRRRFDAIWTWTRDQLGLRDDGLFAWRYQPTATPRVVDLNTASDGDILIAWALAEGASQWRDRDLRRAGEAIARSLMRRAVVERNGVLLLMPGVEGFSASDRADGPVINLSYWVFPAFAPLSALAPDLDWRGLAQSGLDLVARAGFGPGHLPADWTALAGKAPAPATGFPALFGWNALRVPLYLALADAGWGGKRAHLAPFAALWPDGDAIDPEAVDLLGTAPARPFGSSGYRAIPAAVACALSGASYPQALRRCDDEPYYPATLRLLTLAAARRRYPECF